MNIRPDSKAWPVHVSKTLLDLAKSFANHLALIVALTVLALVTTTVSYAQSNAEGYIYGTVSGADSVTAVNIGTGQSRTASVSADGSYLVPALSTGTYNVTAKKGTAVVQKQEGVSVGVGSGTAVRFGAGEQTLQMEKLVVSGSAFSPIDTSQTGASLSIRKETIDILPIGRSMSNVMLLAPGVSQGDAAFGSQPTFAGASVAENNEYINGFNVTNFRNGLGFAEVPFDFYENFQVMVGGYGPEYGRSTGGVTNATTKSGSNRVVTGANVVYNPDGLRNKSPNSYLPNGSIYYARDLSTSDSKNANVYAGFPILKNHVFFYGIYNLHSVNSQFASAGATTLYKDKANDPFWGGKLDVVLNDNHRFEYTDFSDKNNIAEHGYDYDYLGRAIGKDQGLTTYFNGGRNQILRYSGTFGDKFRGSLLYGKGGYNLTVAGAGDSSPAIYDGRSGALVKLGTWTTLVPSTASDARKAYRADMVWTVGDLGHLGKHTIKFGGDYEDNLSKDNTFYSGHVYYRYYKVPASGVFRGVTLTQPYIGAVRVRHYEVGGSFKVQNTAYYIEDDVSLMEDKLKLSLGVRDEGFNNFNKDGKSFIKAKDQIAPRLSVSYDPSGAGKAKLYANYGHYYLPIASNTNVRASGGELFNEQYFTATSMNADSTPVLGPQITSLNVFSNGVAPDPRTLAAIGLSPMYQTEFIVGGQVQLNKNWTLGVRGTYRNLNSTIDDTEVEPAIAKWAARTGNPVFTPDSNYVLFNPGKDLTFLADKLGNGTYSPVTLSVADLDMPPAIRKYYAVTLLLERAFVNNWMINMSYTWSQNYGNFEGWVKSENEQTDAGLTGAFDYPEFMVNSYGRLPNDRRHSLKVFGSYRPSSALTLGFNALLQSGRPTSKLGSPLTISGYDSAIWLKPRGTDGQTPLFFKLDLSLNYNVTLLNRKIGLGLDVFNVLDSKVATKYNETYSDSNQTPQTSYGLVRNYQSPRSVRLSVSIDL